MVGKNRNRKLALNEAWKHYWSVLFPNGVDWQNDLESEIKCRLYDPRDSHGFLSAGDPKPEAPAWASDLEIHFRETSVAFKFLARDVGAVPLFVTQNRLLISNWANKNPLAKAANSGSLPDRDLADCREFLISAVRECSSTIQSRLLGALKETKPPKFDVYCRSYDDVFSAEKRLPSIGIAEITQVGITENELKTGLGATKYSYVQIKQRIPLSSKAGRHGSLLEQDSPLLDEMKNLIEDGKERFVRQAAMLVVSKASSQVGTKEESVLRRLEAGFAAKFPGYMKQRRQKS